jgi:hypothetical protein
MDELGDGFTNPRGDDENSRGRSPYWNSRDGCDRSGGSNTRFHQHAFDARSASTTAT